MLDLRRSFPPQLDDFVVTDVPIEIDQVGWSDGRLKSICSPEEGPDSKSAKLAPQALGWITMRKETVE